MININDIIKPMQNDRWIKSNYTEVLVIDNNKSNSKRTTDTYALNIAKEAVKKGQHDLFAYLMPCNAISQIQSQIALMMKWMQGTVKQNHIKDSYDLPEAASYLNIGKSTLRKALSDKEIIGDRVGRKWRFTKAQLDKYIRRGKSDEEIDCEVEKAILNNKRKHK